MEVLIEYNDKQKTMMVSANGVCAFNGKYWDFDTSHVGLSRFLRQLNCRVYEKEVKRDLLSEE